MLEDKANLVLLQRLMTVPTLESYVANGQDAVAQWAQSRFRHRGKPLDGPPMPPRPPSKGVFADEGRTTRHDRTSTRDAKVTTTTGVTPEAAPVAGADDEGAGGEDWWCVKAAGGNGGLDIWVMHEGNWKSVTEELGDDESYVIQVRTQEASVRT